MRLPRSLLESVRGPALAAALAGCAGETAAVVIEPEPAPLPPIVVAAIDPVEYDVAAETARLETLDATGASDDARRNRRIENGELAARRVVGIGISNDWRHRAILAACGRG